MREEIEWLNYWIEDADNTELRRILLLGDSVARDYRKPLNRMLSKEGYVVDLLAMSHSVFDKLFMEAILHFIDTVGKQYHYDFILFNLGVHHGYSFRCVEGQLIWNEYYQKLGCALKALHSISSNIITITGIPENTDCSDADNDEVEMRNRILESISSESGYQLIDLHKVLAGRYFPMVDRFHFRESGYEYIAIVIKRILDFLIN